MKPSSPRTKARNLLARSLILSLVTTTSLSPAVAQNAAMGEATINLLHPDAFDARFVKLEQDVKDLVGALQSARETIAALEAGMGAMAKAMASSGQGIGNETQSLVAEALTLPSDLSDALSEEMKSLIRTALATIQPGNWAEDMPTGEALQALQQSREAVEGVKQYYEETRKALDATLRSTCKGVPPSETDRIKTVVPRNVPDQWTAELAAAAARAALPLPPCLSDGTGKPNDDLRTFMAEQQASQQMATAMNSMLMAAMSTANPYVIAAVMVLMALMAIFGDNGGGSGDSDSTGNTGEKGGTTIGTAPGPNPAGNETTPGEELPPPPIDPGRAGIPGAYPNVVPGFGATVTVVGTGPTLTFKPLQSPSAAWVVNWGPPLLPPVEGSEPRALPAFSDAVKFISVDFASRSFQVSMPMKGCPTPITVTILQPPGSLGLLVDPTVTHDVCIGGSGS